MTSTRPATPAAVTPGSVGASYPLTPFQKALALESLAAPHSGVEILQALLRPPAPLRRDLLKAAWARVTQRHPALRTSFVLDDPRRPEQRVHPEVVPPWLALDTSAVPRACRHRLLDVLLARDRATGFALDRPLLWRTILLEEGDSAWALLLTVHHAILDGWSVRRVLAELAEEYVALRAGRPSSRRPPPPYESFVRWLGRHDPEPARAFWSRYLAGFEEPTRWEALCRRDQAAGGGGPAGTAYRERRLDLDASATVRLRGEADRAGVSLHTVVRGLWGLLLARCTGSDDVVFGEVRSLRDRSLPGASELAGLLINVVAVRVKVEPRARLAPWLLDLHREWRELRRHAHAAADQVHRWSALPRNDRLFETLLVYDRSPPDGPLATALGEVDLRVLRRPAHPVVLGAWEDGGLALRLGFDHRIEETEAVRLLHRLRWLLESAAGSFDGTLDELSPLPPAERHQVLFEWATGPAAEEGTIPAEVSRRAAAAPDAVALVAGGRCLTYAALRAAARRLACGLQAGGVGPGSVVGVEAARVPAVVVALLAVLEAGGAYLPLDPGQPDRRLQELLRAAGARLVLATAASASCFRRLAVEVVALGEPGGPRGGATAADLAPPDPGDPAYVLFTSGSTGQPKPVAVPHGAVVQLARDPGYARTGPDDAFLHAAPLGFDASTFEIWGALLNGGRLVLADPGPPSLDGLASRVESERVTVLWLTAGLFQRLTRQGLDRLRGLRYLLAGGDVLSVERCREVMALLPDTVVVDGYGPTEATTFTCCHTVDRELPADELSVPVGRPVAGMRVHVLDAGLRPAPAGAPGQLWIGGGGLALGYLGRPAETARAFVPDPWAASPGERLYASGDRARFLPGGEVDFQGRLDRQVKLRGHRVEPGEVESALLRHPEVASAVVVAPLGPGQDLRLVAYIVPAEASRPEPRWLRAFLRERLPPYMVPSAFVLVAALPLTPSGKVDRRALPELLPQPSAPPSRPPTALESRLIGIWRDVLGVAPAGPDEDFFDLGGQSLLAMVVLARLREELGVELTLRQVFDAPTVAGMAATVERWTAERRPREPEAVDSGLL